MTKFYRADSIITLHADRSKQIGTLLDALELTLAVLDYASKFPECLLCNEDIGIGAEHLEWCPVRACIDAGLSK